MERDDAVKNWWDNRHAVNDELAGFYLTGSGGEDVWRTLEVRERIVPGADVLNIGVGKGFCTRDLAKAGCRVSALDISEHALGKVADVIQAGYLASGLDKLPREEFDTALSFLVAQHMNTPNLVRQIKAVLQSLKPEGIFALQFACRLDPEDIWPDESDESCMKGGVCRTLSMLDEIVRRAGGSITLARRAGTFPQYGSGWYILHIAPGGAS